MEQDIAEARFKSIQRVKEMNKFLKSKKRRRRSSEMKEFHGDYLNISIIKNVKKILEKFKESEIVFSDKIAKINRRHKVQERVLMITEKAIYNLHPSNYKILRRIKITKLKSITMSTMPDNFYVLNIPSEYDYLIVSARKTETLSCLLTKYKEITNEDLEVIFDDNFIYRVKPNFQRELKFTEVEDGVVTYVFNRRTKIKKK